MKRFVCLLLILVLVFTLSVGAFAETIISPEKGNTDVSPDDDSKSPQTGDTGAIYWVIAATVLAVGALAFCGKKLVDNK